jgi:protein SCO1/2
VPGADPIRNERDHCRGLRAVTEGVRDPARVDETGGSASAGDETRGHETRGHETRGCETRGCETRDDQPRGHEARAYAPAEVEASMIAKAGVALLAFVAATIGVAFALHAAGVGSVGSLFGPVVSGEAIGRFPEPRPQAQPASERERYFAEQQARMGEYGWVDRKEGVVRIPVERAMALLAAEHAATRTDGAGPASGRAAQSPEDGGPSASAQTAANTSTGALVAPRIPAHRAPGTSTQASLLAGVGLDQRIGASLPLDAPFRDEAGRAGPLGRYFGRTPVVLVLAYYGCRDLCGATLAALAAALPGIGLVAGRDYQVVVASFDPGDTPAEARASKARYVRYETVPEATDGWHFLSGDAEPIARLASAVGFRYRRDPHADAFVHPSAAVLVTPDGRIARYVLSLDPEDAALRYGLIEASGNRLGTPVDRLWLLCHPFDPETGRYGSLVVGAQRILGLATVLALAAGVAALVRRRRGKRV